MIDLLFWMLETRLSFVQNSLTDFIMTDEEKREIENEREKYASMSTDEEEDEDQAK